MDEMNADQTTDEVARRFELFDPETATLHVPGRDALPEHAVLQRAMAARAFHEHEARRVMHDAVDDARAKGLSWNRIGAALGTTGEAARQRYAHRKAS